MWGQHTIEQLENERQRLLLELALFDAEAFIITYEFLARLQPVEALMMVESLIHIGEPRLAVRASDSLLSIATDEYIVSEARYHKAHALFEIDRYDAAENELSRFNGLITPRNLNLQAEVSTTRGDFRKAFDIYNQLLNSTDRMDAFDRAEALRGLGYVLGRIGYMVEAEKCLRDSLDIFLSLGDDVGYAETCGDLGQICYEQGRIPEATHYLEEDLKVCIQNGYLTGIGIVEGMLADIDFISGNLVQAEQRLQRALEIARRVGNRWREGWTFMRLGRLYSSLNKDLESKYFTSEGQKIFQAIGALHTARW